MYSASQVQLQDVLNQAYPPAGVTTWSEDRGEVPVTVRVLWSDDGLEWRPGVAVRRWATLVYVELRDARLRTSGFWVSAEDVTAL